MIRVCLVDDQTLVRQGIRSLLALDDGIEVVAEAADGRQAVEVIPQVKPGRGPDGHAHAGDVRAGGACRRWRGMDAAAADHHPDHLRRRPAGAGRAQGRRQGLPAQGRVPGAAGRRHPHRGRRRLAGAAGGDPAAAVRAGAHAQRVRQPGPARPADRPRDRDPAADGRRASPTRRSPIRWAWPRARSRTTCPTSCPSWACATAPAQSSRPSNCSWSETAPGPPARRCRWSLCNILNMRRIPCATRAARRDTAHSAESGKEILPEPLRADTRDTLSFRSLSMQNRCRHGNRCANPDLQHPRSLLGLALRFNQPGRGIGPGDF